MQKTRLVVETRECECTCECYDGHIDASPLTWTDINVVGDYCIEQGPNKKGECTFLKWRQKTVVDIDSFENIGGVEYAKVRKIW